MAFIFPLLRLLLPLLGTAVVVVIVSVEADMAWAWEVD